MKNGAVTIPVKIRKKYGFEKGSKVDFVDMDEGVLIMPIKPLEKLRGVDKDREEIVFRIIRELHAEHREEASDQGHVHDDESCNRATRC